MTELVCWECGNDTFTAIDPGRGARVVKCTECGDERTLAHLWSTGGEHKRGELP